MTTVQSSEREVREQEERRPTKSAMNESGMSNEGERSSERIESSVYEESLSI